MTGDIGNFFYKYAHSCTNNMCITLLKEDITKRYIAEHFDFKDHICIGSSANSML